MHVVSLSLCGCSSVGRAPAFQADCREFESRRPLQVIGRRVSWWWGTRAHPQGVRVPCEPRAGMKFDSSVRRLFTKQCTSGRWQSG